MIQTNRTILAEADIILHSESESEKGGWIVHYTFNISHLRDPIGQSTFKVANLNGKDKKVRQPWHKAIIEQTNRHKVINAKNCQIQDATVKIAGQCFRVGQASPFKFEFFEVDSFHWKMILENRPSP